MNPVAEATDVVRGKATETHGKLEGAVQNARDRVELTVHHRPVESVLAAVAAGLVAGVVTGLLLRRTTR